MPTNYNYIIIVKARYIVFKWIKAKAFNKINSQAIWNFIYKDIIYKHGFLVLIKANGGLKNKRII